MNLTSLFNFGFLKENFKKSKAIVVLCIFLIPVINVIIYLMNAVNKNIFMPTIYDISSLLIISMYIIPVILSITLFGFVYKRRSCDFVSSMPISRKQMFLTNTVGGIIVLLLMNLFNFIFMITVSLLFNNILVDHGMLFDCFFVWSITYIFIFIVTNLAMTVSSNRITTIVVTLLILFLIPFVHTFISSNNFKYVSDENRVICDSEECKPKNYECYDLNCEVDKSRNIYFANYEKLDSTTYTMPYLIIKEGLFDESADYKVSISLMKMGVLSILYIGAGLVLFKKKKFEVVDTSFKNERVHIFIRSLTTIPIVCICYAIVYNFSFSFSDLLAMLFILVLIMTYLIIYDLITRKKVTNIFKMLVALIVVAIIAVLVAEIPKKEKYIIDVKEIKSLTFDNDNLHNNLGDVKDKDLINYTMSIFLSNSYDSGRHDVFDVIANTSNGTYKFYVSVSPDQYNDITEKLYRDKNYLNSSKKLKNSDGFGISAGNEEMFISKNSILYDKIINEFRKNNGVNNNIKLFNVKLYTYSNYNINTISFNVFDNKDLSNQILKYYNERVNDYLDGDDLNIYSYYIGDLNDETYLSVSDYSILNEFIINHVNDIVDVNKNLKYIKFNTSNGSYVFVTNEVEELDSIIEKIGDSYDESAY